MPHMLQRRRFATILHAGLLATLAMLAPPGHCAAAGAAEPDVVPLHFIKGLPFVDVKVGAAHGEMMFDSGGRFGISVPESLVASSGSVTLLPEKAKFKDIHGKVYEVPTLVAKDVVLGHTALAPVQGRVNLLWGGSPEGPEAELTRARAGGAIDLAALGEHPVMFDYEHASMTIYAPGQGPQPGDPGWLALDLAFDRIGPRVTLSVAGKRLRFVLDTGAPYVAVQPASLGAVANAACPAGASVLICDPNLLADVRDTAGNPLGALHAYRMSFGGAPFDGLLGAPFFFGRRVVFDVAAHRLLITAQDQPRRPQQAISSAGPRPSAPPAPFVPPARARPAS